MDILLPELWRWIAALAGGCTYPFVRPESTWRRNLAVALVGTTVGIIGGHVLCEHLPWQSVHVCNLAHFVAGLLGMILVKVGIATAESTLTPAWMTTMVRRWLGVPDSPQAPSAAVPDSIKCEECQDLPIIGRCSCGMLLCRRCLRLPKHVHKRQRT